MTPLSQVTNIVGFAKKIFTYENGALIFIAAAPSDIFTRFFKVIFHGVPLKTIWMPFLVGAVAILCYVIVFTIDFVTGVTAARKEAHREGIKFKPSSGKLWSSFWKIFVISVMICLVIPFSLVFGALGWDSIHTMCLFTMLLLSISAMLADAISIGENYKRSYGRKPRVFEFIENISKAFNEAVIKKVSNIFK